MTTTTLNATTAATFVDFFFHSESFGSELRQIGEKMPEFCSGSGRGARIIAAREGQVDLFSDGVKLLTSALTPIEGDCFYSSLWSWYEYDAAAYDAWWPTCADRLIGAEIEFFGFEFSATFRAEVESSFGVKIADTPDEAEFKRLRPRGLTEADVAILRPTPYIIGTIENVRNAAPWWVDMDSYWDYIQVPRDLPQAIEDIRVAERLIPAAARVIRNYHGTRLYGALRRAGLEELLRPNNTHYLNAAMISAGKEPARSL